MKIAIKSMGLDDLKPFNPDEKVIEYMIADKSGNRLVDMTCEGFANETASESPAPGGGSISAYMGALGAALGTMVANLSAHKPGWDAKWKTFSEVAVKGQQIKEDLIHLVDEDTNAFNMIMNAFGLPKGTEEEKAARKAAIQEATKYATEVPFRTVKRSFDVFDICEQMIKKGNPNSVTDAAVGVLCAEAAVTGAYLNVKINASSLADKEFANQIVGEAHDYVMKARRNKQRLINLVDKRLDF